MINKLSYCIIIVNFNSTEYVLSCLKSLKNYIPLDKNILIIDNSSIDSPKRIIKKYPKIRLVIQKENTGFSAAVNLGLKLVGPTDYAILLNPDCKPENNFVFKSISFLDQNPDIGILGPKILDPDGCVQGSARSFPTPLTALFGRKSLLTKLFPKNRISCRNILTNDSDGNTPMVVDWVSGACMIIRRKCIEAVGGFDERFFLYWEDADLCKRIKDAGWKVIYFPQAKIVHYIGKSSNSKPILSICQFHKSCYLLFKKYTRWPKILSEPIAVIGLGLRCFVAIVLSLVNKMLYQRVNNKQFKEKIKPADNKPIKVLRVISRLNIGGPAIHVAILVKGLDRNKFSNKLVVGQLSDQEGDMAHIIGEKQQDIVKIPYLQRNISPIDDICAFFRMLKIIIKEKPDIVHTHLSKAGAVTRPAVFLFRLMKRKNIKTVHTFHGHVFNGYFGRFKTKVYILIERILAQFTDIIIVLSEKQKKELTEKYNIVSEKKTRIIPLGLNLKIFKDIQEKPKGRLREKIGCDDKEILIGIVGRLVPIKNHFMFFNAAKYMLQKQNDINIKFVVIGSGELKDELKSYCKKLGLDTKVIFCGWVSDMASVYRDIDILALTSINEGTPVSVIEAMASGVPVVATRVGGVPDLMGKLVSEVLCSDNGFYVYERGIVCPNNDYIAFANAMDYLLTNKNKEIGLRICRNAKRFAYKSYSKERLLNDISQLYFELSK